MSGSHGRLPILNAFRSYERKGERRSGVSQFLAASVVDPGMVTNEMAYWKKIWLFGLTLTGWLSLGIASVAQESSSRLIVDWIPVRQSQHLAFPPPAKPSQMMHSAPSPELSLFEIIAVCEAARTESGWSCEEIRSGQYRTSRSYGRNAPKIHLVIEAVGFGSTPRASLGTDLPGEALVARRPLCSQNFRIDRCRKGQQTVGELFEFDITTCLKNKGMRSFEASSVDVNHPSNLQKTRIVIGE